MLSKGKEILKKPGRIGLTAGESAMVALNRIASEGGHHRRRARPVEAFVSNDFCND